MITYSLGTAVMFHSGWPFSHHVVCLNARKGLCGNMIMVEPEYEEAVVEQSSAVLRATYLFETDVQHAPWTLQYTDVFYYHASDDCNHPICRYFEWIRL